MNKTECTILLPTFNEENNIVPMVNAIKEALLHADFSYEIIFIDDSDDSTPQVIKKVSEENPFIGFIHREKSECTGLATALLKGFEVARGQYICCMDSDLQHPPSLIPELIELLKNGNDLSIGSRFVHGGSNIGLKNIYRKFVSNISSFIAQSIFYPTRKTSDPMTGFFAFKKKILENQPLYPKGFKILVEILVRIPNIKVADAPLKMEKRLHDETKANFKQGMEYLKHLFKLAWEVPKSVSGVNYLIYIYHKIKYLFYKTRIIFGLIRKNISVIVVSLVLLYLFVFIYSLADNVPSKIILTVAVLQISQGIFSLYIMTYAWGKPDRIIKNSSPKDFIKPKYSFTAIVPARNEPLVIAQTIKSVANINYPSELKETLIVLRDDDTSTIEVAQKTLDEIGMDNVKIILISGPPENKNNHLNSALKFASKEIVCIFDAEDEPHRDIYKIVNTVLVKDDVDVVQSGVQLMNYDSNWYSLFNVLEYFLWFGSALHFFAKHNLIPLGGNTVFFKRRWLEKIGGWDVDCLTEDADIGIRLSLSGAKTKVIYDPQHVTREETPSDIFSFIRQRTRWNQGFIQILTRGKWMKTDKLELKKKFLTVYILGWPIIQAMLFFSIPLSIFLAFTLKINPFISIMANIPILILITFLVMANVALHDFIKLYRKKYSPDFIIKSIVWYLPFQFVLGFSAFRATIRHLKNQGGWEKTEHINAHRSNSEESSDSTLKKMSEVVIYSSE